MLLFVQQKHAVYINISLQYPTRLPDISVNNHIGIVIQSKVCDQ